MFATEILRKEHDAILKMLNATDEVGERILRGERIAPDTLNGLHADFGQAGQEYLLSDLTYVSSLGPLWTLYDLKFDGISFRQGPISNA